MLLSDIEIAERCNASLDPLVMPQLITLTPLIRPFSLKQVRTDENNKKIVSYGLSSYGYDVRLADDFKVFRTQTEDGYGLLQVPIDPLRANERDYIVTRARKDGTIIIPAGGFLLGRTVEYFNVPRDILVMCLGKSTLARLGIQVIVTPLEPEWSGELVLEIYNCSPRPVKLYVGHGIAQLVFSRGGPIKTSYADRAGKYQGQIGVVTAKV